MVIKRSVSQETRALISELDADDDVRREAAIARLAVIGTRAVDRLVAVLGTPGVQPRTQAAVLRTLESIVDIRGLAPASALLDSPHAEVARAAVGVLRAFLHSPHETTALDDLVAVALDPARPDAGRLAALDALAGMGSRVVTPIWQRLREDPSLAVRQRAARETGGVEPLDELEAAAAGAVPDDGETLSRLVAGAAGDVPLGTLHRLIQVTRTRETAARSAAEKDEWVAARGAVHLALASRDSRVALYDLRDSVAAATGRLPVSYLSAIEAIGDATALEAIASAYAHSRAAADPDWLEQLKTAFRAIAAREGAGPRSAVVRRIAAKWPEAAGVLIEKRLQRSGSR